MATEWQLQLITHEFGGDVEVPDGAGRRLVASPGVFAPRGRYPRGQSCQEKKNVTPSSQAPGQRNPSDRVRVSATWWLGGASSSSSTTSSSTSTVTVSSISSASLKSRAAVVRHLSGWMKTVSLATITGSVRGNDGKRRTWRGVRKYCERGWECASMMDGSW